MEVSEKTMSRVSALDIKLNTIQNREANYLKSNLVELLEFKKVEVGWRESCGTTDFTMKVYREWKKIVTLLVENGFKISEQRVNHGNAYATSKGGFWNSIIYTIE